MARMPAIKQKTEATTVMAKDQLTASSILTPKMANPTTMNITDRKQNMTRAIMVEFLLTV